MTLKIKRILLKKNKSKIICLTSYSKNFASIVDKYSDIILVEILLDLFYTIIIQLDMLRLKL